MQKESTFHPKLYNNKPKNKSFGYKDKRCRRQQQIQDEYIVIAIDSTGIKVTNRGQWMQDKWQIRKKGYLKIHVAENIKTKKILAIKINTTNL